MKLKMRAKIASIHNKIEITDEDGNPVYHIHGKVFSLHDTYEVDIVDEERMDLIVAVLVALDKIVGDRQRVVSASDDAARIHRQD